MTMDLISDYKERAQLIKNLEESKDTWEYYQTMLS